MHKTLIRSFPRARRTKLIVFFVFITMSSVPFQALKTNSLIAFDLFELVVAGLLKIVGFAQTIGLSFPNASLSLAKISGSFHTIILSITFRAHYFVPIEEKAVSLRLVICPPGRRSAAAAPAARQPTLPRPPTLNAVKLAFLPAPPHASRMRLRLQSRQLGSSPPGTFAAQGTSALTAMRRRDCGRRTVHRLARAHAQMAPAQRPSVPDRRPANALLRGKRSR